MSTVSPCSLAMDSAAGPQPPLVLSETQKKERRKSGVRKMSSRVWNVDDPREFQLEAIMNLAFTKKKQTRVVPASSESTSSTVRPTVTAVIRNTADGKTHVVNGAATLLRGVCLFLVPLQGLGANQASKSSRPRHNVYAYHLDEIKEGSREAKKMMERVLLEDGSTGRRLKKTFLIYASPQSLQKTTWQKFLLALIEKSLLSLIAFDEAHRMELDGYSYRPEFKELKKFLIDLLVSRQYNVPMVALSATFIKESQARFEAMLNVKIDTRFWGNMDRRHIDLSVYIGTKVTTKWKSDVKDHVQRGHKVLLYTNSAKNAQDDLRKHAQNLLASAKVDGDVLSITGDTGIIMKKWILDKFAGNASSIANVVVVTHTTAADAGIHSPECLFGAAVDIPTSLVSYFQLIGRVGRGPRQPGDLQDRYVLCVSLSSFLVLMLRIESDASSQQRNKQRKDFLEMVKFAVSPAECQQVTLEEKMESPSNTRPRLPCLSKCSFCRGEYKTLLPPVSKDVLIVVLDTMVFAEGRATTKRFVDSLKNVSKEVWNKPSVLVGQIHGLMMQLAASKIVEVKLKSLPKDKKARIDDLEWRRVKLRSNGSIPQWAYTDSNRWIGINLLT